MSGSRRQAAEALRQRAEALLAASPAVDSRDEAANITALAHEIAVHQAELELQNDELQDTQAALQDARDRFAELFESAPVGYVVLDAAGIVRQANATWCAMLNRENDDVRGQPFADAIVSEDTPVFLARFRTFFRNPTDKQIVVRMTRVGAAPFYAQIEAKPRLPEQSAAYKADADLQELMVIVSDVTDRKRADAERDQLREELAQARRIESVGRLAGGVAHDFNNMLGVILGHTEIALDHVDPSQPIFDNLQEIRKAAERSADLTRQLLAFGRKQTIAPRVLDLNETIESMLKLLRRLIGEGVELAWLPGKNLGSVMMDPTQIDQIMANLCVNARDAIGGQGTVTIETGTAVFGTADCAERPGLRPGNYVWAAVRDNGCGMDAETLARLFEPFFTTKEMGRGTGLGLATVYGIVKQNDGYIDVHSKPGAGTTFTFYLPSRERRAD
ncbi:MAG: ATP-binding protein [Vicinamibacterales bacterium]|nr:ATP-binding protein [Vicinamibacterales bacterium]